MRKGHFVENEDLFIIPNLFCLWKQVNVLFLDLFNQTLMAATCFFPAVEHNESGLRKALQSLVFKNEPGVVRKKQNFAYISQCGLYTEPQNISQVRQFNYRLPSFFSESMF